MRRVNFIFLLCMVFLFNGCFDFLKNNEKNENENKVEIPKKKVAKYHTLLQKQTYELTKNSKMSIRGEVLKEEFIADEGRFYYEIISKENTKRRLDKAGFYANNFKFGEGDIVYAIIYKGKLQEVYLIEKSKKFYMQKTSKKRTIEKKAPISPPDSEIIRLN